MAANEIRGNSGDAHHVQDMGLRGVPRQADGSVLYESRGRRLSLAILSIHDRHLQNRAGVYVAQCKICRKGLEGALAAPEKVEVPIDPSEVVPGDRADEAGPAAPAHPPGTLSGINPVLRSRGT